MLSLQTKIMKIMNFPPHFVQFFKNIYHDVWYYMLYDTDLNDECKPSHVLH